MLRLGHFDHREPTAAAKGAGAADALVSAFDGLDGQRTDLLAAIEKTRSLISELDALIARQFRATFAALETAFDRQFQQLFGGGYARLSLTDPGDGSLLQAGRGLPAGTTLALAD